MPLSLWRIRKFFAQNLIICLFSNTYNLIQAYLKSGNESVKKYLASVEWETANDLNSLSRAIACNAPSVVENLLRNGVSFILYYFLYFYVHVYIL